jgi:hypothetical protein
MLVSAELRRQNMICEHIYRIRSHATRAAPGLPVFGLDSGSSPEWRKTVIYENSENSQYSNIIYKHHINLPQQSPSRKFKENQAFAYASR